MPNIKIKPAYLAILFVLLVVISNSVFIVDQRTQAIVLQFGSFVKAVKKPGLNVKIPFMQNVILFDNRVLDLSSDSREVIASDQKRLIVDSFAKFKIVDPLKFYQSVRDENNARSRLSSIVDSSLRQVIGGVPLTALLTGQRIQVMKSIRDSVNMLAKDFGIVVVDVRIMRADLPQTNSDAVFLRMQTEREREAKEFRAQGAEEAQRIRATAEKERTLLLAEAQRKAQIMRGEGEGEATKIFASAFGRDPEFAAFMRSMQAYRESFSKDDTTIVISPTGDFMKYFD